MAKGKNKLARIILFALAIVCFSVSAVSFLLSDTKKADAIETGVLSTTHMSVEKNVFNVGEPILVKATSQNIGGKDWVGIAKTDVTTTSIRWRYVDYATDNSYTTGFGSGAAMDVKQGKLIGNPSEAGVAGYENIPAGSYRLIFVLNDGGASSATEEIPIKVVDTGVSDSYLTISKTDFYEGEDIVFSHNVASPDSKDWIGVCGSTYSEGAIKWDYVTTASGEDIVANDVTQRAKPDYQLLPAGNYNIIYVLNNGNAYSAVSVIPITVHAKIDGVKETTHLSLEKTTFYAGEPILVTPTEATTDGTDWIGISENVSKGSIRWKYISTTAGSGATAGAGNGVEVDMREASLASVYSSSSLANIPAGYYKILFGADDCSGYLVTEYVNIQVLETPNPDAPSEFSLVLDNATDGFIDGDITVTFDAYDTTAEYLRPTDIIMYWADENGNKLTEYAPLAKRKISSVTTTFNTYSGVIIPTNAKKLLVYAIASSGKLSEPYVYTLPDGCQYKNDSKLIMEYNVVSDIHITTDPTNDKTTHYGVMLEDIAKTAPNSQGIMVVGDAVDTGSITEYEYLVSKHAEIKATYGDDLAPLYFSIGNHELMCGIDGNHEYNVNRTDIVGDDATQIARWREYVLQVNSDQFDGSVPYYTRWTGGIQHIYLSTEALSSRAGGSGYLSTTQLNWLDNQLASNTTGNPIMIYIHQPFYETVAGALEPANWDNILAGVTTSYGTDATSRYKNEQAARDIFAKYADTKDMFMFSGHSHWYFDAEHNMRVQDGMPTMFNTSSVGYLWNDYDVVDGVYERGSQGYYVRVYEDRIEFLGRNFDEANWASSAQFVVYTHTHDYEESYDEDSHFEKCSCGDIINDTPHDLTDGSCDCGYHEHTYVADYDEDSHFEKCSCGDIINDTPHDLTDGDCDCGYHEHTYVADYDEDSHFEKCSCGDIINDTPHDLTDGSCDCGYVDPNYEPPTGGDEDEGGDVVTPPGGDDTGDTGLDEGGSEQQPSTDGNQNNNNSSSGGITCAMAVNAFDGSILVVYFALMLTAFVVIKSFRKKSKNN